MGGRLQIKPQKALAKATQPNLRAQAKEASRDKIVMAARKLFAEQGYDNATLRQISLAAGLGQATLFNHIREKRDLIYLIFNDETGLLIDRSLAAIRPWQSFAEKILTITEGHFRMFAGEPRLSSILLSEIVQQAPGPELKRYLAIRARLLQGIERIVADAQQANELKPEPEAGVVAQSIFLAFSGTARWWLSSNDLDWRSGQRAFERLLNMMLFGMLKPPAGERAVTAGERGRRTAKDRPGTK